MYAHVVRMNHAGSTRFAYSNCDARVAAFQATRRLSRLLADKKGCGKHFIDYLIRTGSASMDGHAKGVDLVESFFAGRRKVVHRRSRADDVGVDKGDRPLIRMCWCACRRVHHVITCRRCTVLALPKHKLFDQDSYGLGSVLESFTDCKQVCAHIQAPGLQVSIVLRMMCMMCMHG